MTRRFATVDSTTSRCRYPDPVCDQQTAERRTPQISRRCCVRTRILIPSRSTAPSQTCVTSHIGGGGSGVAATPLHPSRLWVPCFTPGSARLPYGQLFWENRHRCNGL